VTAGREVKEAWKARVLRGLKGVVTFSPDGKHLVALSSPQLVVFDAADGKDGDESRRPLMQFERHSDEGAIQHAAFTPDGRSLVVGTAGMSGRVELWDLESRRRVHTFTTGYGGISRLCVFPDGTRAASAGAEEAVTVWGLTTRDEEKEK
jgi:WD40 repeat protein